MELKDIKRRFMEDMVGFFRYDWKHRSSLEKEIIRRLVESPEEEKQRIIQHYLDNHRKAVDDLVRGGYIIYEEEKYKLVPAFIEGGLDWSGYDEEIDERILKGAGTIESLLRRRNEIDEIIRKEYKQKITVMFTDIVGSTEYFLTKGDIAGRAMVQRHNDMLFPIIEKHNGKIIKTIGDAIMAGFEKAQNGVLVAIEMQKALAKYNQGAEDKIQIRIGIHTGLAITEPDDIYGDTVHIAARIEALAEGDQILISGEIFKEIEQEGFNLRFHGKYLLKGLIEDVPIYEVLWDESQKPRKPEIKVKPEKGQVKMPPSLHNQLPPEPNFVGRVEMLKAITDWYKSPEVKIGALVGWGGVGKSALVRKWYDSLKENNIHPDGIFWWDFYKLPSLDHFIAALFAYLSQDRFKLDDYKTSWQKIDKIKELLLEREYLIILDGLEQMQKSQTGEEFGKMQHPEFTDLLKYIADADFKGLCLITTRFPLTDIKNYPGYQKIEIEELPKEDTWLLFQRIGVRGTEDEIDDIWKEFKGHTLSLVLLANYLGPGGDIKKAKEIPPFYSDQKAGGKAHRILLWYDKQLNEEQRRFMKIFSLFRGAVSEREFKEVFQTRVDFHFQRMLNDLCQRRLITKGSDNTYTTHPLIKGYFESIFDKKEKKLTHKAIYEYFGKKAPDKPETLDQMRPLFEQVYHGCSARLYDKVDEDVYWGKIQRREEGFLVYKLGVWETDLSLVRTFFPDGDLSKMPLVSEKRVRGWLLNEAGLALLNTGRPKEAEELFVRKTNMQIEDKDRKNASAGYQNLADLWFRVGRLKEANESAKKAIEMAEKAESEQYIVISKAYLAWILHLAGKDEEAEKEFQQADELSRKISGYQLYAMRGIFYADFLLSIKQIDEAFELTKANLKICQRNNFVNEISRCHRLLGAIERIKGKQKEAEPHLQEALEIARKVGMPELEIEALLELSRLWLDMKRYKEAISQANQVLKLCERTGFLLYEPEAELILARAYLGLNDLDQTKTFAQSAYQKASQMHYHWPRVEAEQLLRNLNPC
ncbi:MAG: adenylate/guanylate cyclase domain-containing protein [bacterium]